MIDRKTTRDIGLGKSIETYIVSGRERNGLTVSVSIPIVRLTGQNGKGPCLLFTGGIHGDEYEGPYVLSRLARELNAGDLCGEVVIAPTLNPSALMARRRRSPFDDQDLNRSFPGDARGLITEAIAAFMMSELLPNADVVIDIHAAGDDNFLVPGPLGHHIENLTLRTETLSLMKAFAAPCALLVNEANADTMWDHQVEAAGKVFFTAELGSAASLTPETMQIAWRSVNNALIHLKIMDGELQAYYGGNDWGETKLLVASGNANFPPLPHPGFFVPLKQVGNYVNKGDTIGELVSIDQPTTRPYPVLSSCDGILFSNSTGGYVDEDKWWTIIATEAEWSPSAYNQLAQNADRSAA